jgi:hypothetical protein
MLPKPPKDPHEVLFENLTLLTPQERREPMGKTMCLGVSIINQPEETLLDPNPLSSNLGPNSPAVFKATATSVAERATMPKTAELLLT